MKRNHGNANGRRRRGATAVELAVVAPALFMLVFGVFEFGRMVMVKQALTDASRAGCRKASLATTRAQDDAVGAVHACLQGFIADTSSVSVTVSPGDLSQLDRGAEITTTVEVDYADVSWIPPSFLGTVVLRCESVMTRE